MNYWPAESTNLAECVEPLTAHGEGSRRHRRAHSARDVRRPRLGGPPQHRPVAGDRADRRPAVGPVADRRRWLALALWDHYDYTGDRAFLADDLSAAQGRGAVLPRHAGRGAHRPAGSSPPRRSRRRTRIRRHVARAGPTMDQQILRDLFASVIRRRACSASIASFRAQVADDARPARAEQIGGAGQLQEWLEDWDMQAPEMHHRHVSHLYGLYPGREIDVRRTPELAAAASARSRSAATRPPAGPRPGASTCGRACATATTPTRS